MLLIGKIIVKNYISKNDLGVLNKLIKNFQIHKHNFIMSETKRRCHLKIKQPY